MVRVDFSPNTPASTVVGGHAGCGVLTPCSCCTVAENAKESSEARPAGQVERARAAGPRRPLCEESPASKEPDHPGTFVVTDAR